jgi:adenine-specific DNA-methyltransferase
MEEPKKMDLRSTDITEEHKAKLKKLFPNVFNEDKIDFERLRQTLGEDIDVGLERFGLTWPGKSECMKIIQQPSIGTLKPCKEESVNFNTTENLFIEGDNLEVLKLLQKSYYGKVKMIYIDPPYNTGKEFIYPDKYSESLETYLAYTGQVDAEGKKFSTNTEADGRFHSKWLNMMYPRLYLSRNLLRDDGVIFISIDDNEASNLRKICDEIFGGENFRGEIVRATGTTTGQDGKKIGSSYDLCLCYSKSQDYKQIGLPLVGKDLNRFNNDENDGKGKYALLQLRKTGYADRKEDRENMFYSVVAPDGTKVFPVGPSGYLSRWRVGPTTYKEFLKNGLIVWKKSSEEENEDNDDEFDNQMEDAELEDSAGVSERIDISEYKSDWRPYVKYYLSGRTKQVSNLWADIDGNKKGSLELKKLFSKKKIFDNPKPTDFINRVIRISCKKSDIVLDFFAGSSTTAHAILDLNNQGGLDLNFILIQLPELCDKDSETFKAGYKTIADIGKERIRRVIKKIQEEPVGQLNFDKNILDLGFKVLKLDKSNFKIWDGTVAEIVDDKKIEKQLELQIEHINPKAKEEDILYELLLKSGFTLTTKVEILTLAGKKVYSIESNALLICLEKSLTSEVITEMARKEPARVVCLDIGFAGNDQLKTNAVQIMKSHKVEDFRTV